MTLLFDRFEAEASKAKNKNIEDKNMRYAQQYLNPYLTHSPFFKRSYEKPLGYAGDYEMVNMMFNHPYKGKGIFGKLMNRIHCEYSACPKPIATEFPC